jgi:hypothetical protein
LCIARTPTFPLIGRLLRFHGDGVLALRGRHRHPEGELLRHPEGEREGGLGRPDEGRHPEEEREVGSGRSEEEKA